MLSNKCQYPIAWMRCLELENNSFCAYVMFQLITCIISICHHFSGYYMHYLHMNRYHLRCEGPTLADTNDAALYICHYCHFLGSGKISQNGGSPLVCIFYLSSYKVQTNGLTFFPCRFLEESVLNLMNLLSFYLMRRISLYGNELLVDTCFRGNSYHCFLGY